MASRDTKPTPDEELADDLAQFYDDPLGYVMFCFPWDSDPSIQMVELVEPWASKYGCKFGPDKWACEFLEQLGTQIKERGFDGRHAVMPIRFATASGHGIGKSTLTAWLIKFILDTRPYAKGIVTAMTEPQLRTKTWAELGKWHRISLTAHWFEYSSGRGSMSLCHKKYKEQWRADAQTCKEENSEAFAGLHAANSTPFYIFDEASGIPDKIFEVRDGGTTDGEPMVFDFGNPTRNSGRFFEECEGKLRQFYIVRHIDSRTVQISNKRLFEEWLKVYSEEDDYIKVRVRGMFPLRGTLQFISTDIVAAAMGRPEVQHPREVVLGVDVAREGDDDSVIYPRLGVDARSFEPKIYNGLDTIALTGKIVEMVRYFSGLGVEVRMIFVDEVGVGGGVVDQLNALGYPVMGVKASRKANDDVYASLGDEMWGKMRDAIQRDLVLPVAISDLGRRLQAELTQREFGYTVAGNKMRLESKRDMKARLGSDKGSSPDVADALGFTYAMELPPLGIGALRSEAQVFAKQDYDPYADAEA